VRERDQFYVGGVAGFFGGLKENMTECHNSLIKIPPRSVPVFKSFSHWIVTMAEEQDEKTMNTETMTSTMRYYHFNRETVLAQRKAAYDSRADVIARREEKERIREEKATLRLKKKQEEDAVKQEAKQKRLQEKFLLAEKTKRVFKKSQNSPSEASSSRS